MQLSCRVNSRWKSFFNNPRASHSSIWGKGPETFRVDGAAIVVSSDGHDAQTLVNYAKSYIQIANRTYADEVVAEHRKQIAQEKMRLKEVLERTIAEQAINQNLEI